MTKARLSAQQATVVEHVEGALLVIAGPGSGKTRVLTERIRRLLTVIPGHFRVLALTFTNKAANEMKERLSDLGDVRQRAFVGTLHSFCLDMLTERGKLVGVTSLPHIFEQFSDRKEILHKAVLQDPLLSDELDRAGDAKARNKRLDDWLQGISWVKAHPITCEFPTDDLDKRVIETYDAGLRACDAYDFDDLLLLAYRLLSSYPKIADFYRRLYKFVCIDEAQDLNEAQYAVLTALCGEDFKNVLMVGDPKQSIYGFNTSSPDYMWRFRDEFGAGEIELTENFRSSSAVVQVARSLEPHYLVEAQLPIPGAVSVLVGIDETDEAHKVVDEIQRLISSGHEDIEGNVTPSNCAILGRTRYALMAIETELKERGISYYKRLTANHENESATVDEFQLALRVLANPRDRLHLTALAKKWKLSEPKGPAPANEQEVRLIFSAMANVAKEGRASAIVDAIDAVARQTQRLDLMLGIKSLRAFADSLPEVERLVIYEDLAVLQQEWDQYLRSDGAARTIAGFMSSKALGATQQASRDGVALLTVHSSKGLEFDVVFIAGMADGVFPDYRAQGKKKEMAEEARNAFVAVTRSKRLLYLSFPKRRMMPWGDEKRQQPSCYLRQAGLVE
ncbi:ATP-dependent helicase [Geotalea uraniireducens]|uniref:DNA 3'-5' helicase n=1 Tax=Geotalea uraniireducens (strain Rf4) TaxID=351605 RepID=A5GF30_GEOUR|nr:ATP-dependent helicase [Geotalea uraniireducens]ABQ26035.1 UvrD/REP helicase [Geotalea uraniireducens Rf4]